MRSRWILLFPALAACAHVQPKPDVFESSHSLEEALAYLQPKTDEIFARHKVPDAALGVVAGGRLIWFRGFGTRDVEGRQPVDAKTAFRIGSITKTLTSVALLQLRDAGKLSLDDPLTKYIPEAAGLVNPGTEPVRLRNLVTHTSGLGREVMPHEGPTQAELLAALKGLRLEFEPGTAESYSNYAMALAGVVVERASGEPYRQYMQRHVFDPLGMSSTAFDDSALPAGTLAVGYQWTGDGPYRPIPKQRLGGAMEACGGLYSTVDDLAKYAAFELGAWAGRQSTVLSARSLRESHTPTAMPLSAGSVVGVNWIIDRSRVGRSIWHNGGIDGYSALLALYPNRDAAVIVLMGGDAGGMPSELEAAAVDVLQSWEPVLDVPLGPDMQRAFHRLIDLNNGPSQEKFVATFSSGFREFLLGPQGSFDTFVTKLHHWFGRCPDTGVTVAGGTSTATVWYACQDIRTAMTLWLEPETGLISGWRWDPWRD